MPLPSSIWVKFTSEDAVLVTYLGVEYRLVFDDSVNGTPYYLYFLTGNATSGTVLYLDADGITDFSGVDVSLTFKTAVVTDEAIVDSVAVGTADIINWFITSFTGASISSATIVHRDSRLPLFVELPYTEDVAFELQVNSQGYRLAWDFYGNLFDTGFWVSLFTPGTSPEDLSNVLTPYSLTWDFDTNTGTTDCPFVSFIGELSELDTFIANGTWTPPSNIDITKPVIVEAWGSGATAGDFTGGGGGAYAASDIYDLLEISHNVGVSASNSGDNTSVVVDPEDENTSITAISTTTANGAYGPDGFGQVKFSGANGSAMFSGVGDFRGGGSAYPYQDAIGPDGYGAGGIGYMLAAQNGGSGGIPGGGGGTGDSGYVAGAGAGGEVRIHYRLSASNSEFYNVGLSGHNIGLEKLTLIAQRYGEHKNPLSYV